MSLEIICSECDKPFAYFSGSEDERFKFDKNTDKIYVISKSVGNRGVTFDNSKLVNSVYICEDCLKKNLKNAFNLVKEVGKNG